MPKINPMYLYNLEDAGGDTLVLGQNCMVEISFYHRVLSPNQSTSGYRPAFQDPMGRDPGA